jgi:hypothetical protein
MGLLAPLFLLGLGALLVPVLVHLRHRERHKTHAFPSLMFLQKIPYRSMRRRRLHQLALFTLRCLAIALFAAAFARPFFSQGLPAAAPLAGARERVILLDRSYSMGYGQRFAKAKDAARRAVEELGATDRVSLILFSEKAEGSVPSTEDRARVLAALDAARPAWDGTRYGPALKLAQEWLQASPLPRREAILISDFQKAGWTTPEEIQFPEGATLTWVDLSEADAVNAAVADVSLERDFVSGRERVLAKARLVNKSARSLDGVRVSLEVGGRVVEEKRQDLEPGSAASVAFEPFAFPAALTRAAVRLESDPLLADNAFHFVLAPGQALPVLLVGGDSGRALYVRRALAIGDRPRFAVTSRGAAGLAPADVDASAAYVILPGGSLEQRARRALEAGVRDGGGLLVALGADSDDASLRALADLVPGRLGSLVDRAADRGGTLAYLDYDHPAFALFKSPRSGDFAGARFLRYRALRPSESARVLARFDDGQPALVEAPLGKGKLLAWASGFDSLSSDLPLQPVFLPFLHQLLKYAASHRESRPAFAVGEVVDVPAAAEAEMLVLSPTGAKRRLAKGERLITLDEAGFHEIRRPSGGSEASSVVAVNVPAAESDFSRLDPEELAAAVQRGRGASARAAAPVTPEDAEHRQSLWWYLLASALVLLLAETAFSNRLSRVAVPFASAAGASRVSASAESRSMLR